MSKLDAERLNQLVARHAHYTNSAKAKMILADWRAYLPKFKKVVHAVTHMAKTGFWHYDQHPHNRKTTPGYFGTLQSFLPDELAALIKKHGFRVNQCHALGSLANLCGQGTVDAALKHRGAMEEFLNLCEHFDKEIMPGGPGTKQRAGLIAVAYRCKSA